MKKQKYKSKEDESLGMRTGKESSKTQSYKSRRKESKSMSHPDEKQDKMLINKMVKKGCRA